MYGEDLEGRLFLGCFGSIFASLFRGIIRIRGTWIAMSPMLQGRRPMSGLKLSLVSSIVNVEMGKWWDVGAFRVC